MKILTSACLRVAMICVPMWLLVFIVILLVYLAAVSIGHQHLSMKAG
jgi:hypothetical protein